MGGSTFPGWYMTIPRNSCLCVISDTDEQFWIGEGGGILERF